MCEPLTSIINESFRSGVFPSELREAVVKPILKKPSLDKEVLKNYRPVSNISYVSKVMEKIVSNQLKHHLDTHNLLEPFQSAYKAKHSTETTLLGVRTDILKAMDNNEAVAVVLLDLSAAFDTVDQGFSIGGPRATSGPPSTGKWPLTNLTKQRKTKEKCGIRPLRICLSSGCGPRSKIIENP